MKQFFQGAGVGCPVDFPAIRHAENEITEAKLFEKKGSHLGNQRR